MAPAFDLGAPCLNRLLDDRAQVDALLLKLELAGPDTRDVEKILDQPGHVSALPADDFDRAIAGRFRDMPPDDCRGGGDGANRITQLVAERREEIILPATRLLGSLE